MRHILGRQRRCYGYGFILLYLAIYELIRVFRVSLLLRKTSKSQEPPPTPFLFALHLAIFFVAIFYLSTFGSPCPALYISCVCLGGSVTRCVTYH